MVSNFELLMGFKNMRDFAVCMSKNTICCHKDSIASYDCVNHNSEDDCRRCWLDFLTSDEGLDLSYLDKADPVKKRKNLLEE